ncbi:MAG: ATP-binding protein, partial [Ignavibacteriaceae bacterium]|nr:ATP-binding protein [Ignavibacteriaceae bacterium]
ALERSKRYKDEAVQRIKNFVPIAVAKAKEGFEQTKGFYKRGIKIFGLAPKQVGISSEISDFLAETYKAIQLLPFVYQRLFKVEPLITSRFFEGRVTELNQLNNALSNWEKNYFAPVVLVGEKGSGATTTINIFLQSLEINKKIYRVSIEKPTYSEKDFLNLLSGLFNHQQFSCTEDVINYLNSLPSRSVVVIENLQHIYLKAVSGFNSFKIFFEIISQTNKNIFWITTSTLYAWQYLDKTITVADYFGYVIKLNELTNNQIVEMINKRHRVSGYNILFRPSADDLESKAYKKLDDSGQQKYLRDEYFNTLNKFSKSNISLALLFWLRSTTDVTKDTITIRSLKNLDFSFLGSLSNQKIFTLAALMLHDGLTVEAHSEIFSLTTTQSRLSLLVLFDDGIVIKKGDLFLINPLLYRQTVSLLQSKNIIH